MAGKTFSPEFIFKTTNGKFYYRYNGGEGYDCTGNNIALRKSDSWYSSSLISILTPPSVADSPYIITVPQKTVKYNINIYQPNRPPNAPTITTGTVSCAGNSSTFTFRAADADGDQVRYLIDWDNNGTGDQWVPASGRVASNTAKSVTRIWTTTGSKTFRVLTEDDNGTRSTWVTKTITIPACPINGQCGTAHNKIYPSTRTSYTPDTLCAQ